MHCRLAAMPGFVRLGIGCMRRRSGDLFHLHNIDA